jgi:hypothetical protein
MYKLHHIIVNQMEVTLHITLIFLNLEQENNLHKIKKHRIPTYFNFKNSVLKFYSNILLFNWF